MPIVWIQSIVQDVAHGVQVFRRRPAIFFSAVLVLGLTIGCAMAMLMLMERLLLRPLSVRDPGRLVQIMRPAAPGGLPQESFPRAFFEQLREQANQFATLLTIGYPGEEFVSYSSDDFRPEAVRTQSLDVAALIALGIQPLTGRVFEPGDERLNAEPVAILSEDYWRQRFMSAPDVIGRNIRRRNRSFRIVGVLQRPTFELDAGSLPDVWLPITEGQGGRILAVLRPGAQPRELESVIAPTFQRYLSNESSSQARQGNARFLAKKLDVVDASTGMSAEGVRKRFATPLIVMTIAAIILLVIGCANVGLLLFYLQVSRHGEIAIRIALGASRGRLIRQTVLETAILGVIGCILGSGLAPLITTALVGLSSDPDRPIRFEWQWDWRFAAVAFVFGGLTTFLCASAATFRWPWRSPVQSIHDRFYPALPNRKDIHPENFLVSGQAALALVLLVGSGLLQTTWRNLNQLNPGFDKERLLIAELQWEQEGNRAYTNSVYQTLVARVSRLPGVQAASISGWSYFGDNSRRASIITDNRSNASAGDNPLCEFLSVGPGFFETVGVPILRGRGFTSIDLEGSPLVAVLNQSAVREYFDSANAVGHRFTIFDPNKKIEIVGVVADTKLNSLRESAPAMVYLPFLQSEFRGTSNMPASLEVRLAPGSHFAAEDLHRLIRTSAPGLASRRVQTQGTLIQRSLVRERLLSVISVSLGILAVLLAALALAGVVAQSVARRTKEFGIRLALGAHNRELIAGALRQALRPVAAGGAAGVLMSIVVTRLLSSVLFRVDPFDPFVVTGAILLFLAVAAVAAYIPLVRVSQIDPAIALRRE